jgi:hypothetical protein
VLRDSIEVVWISSVSSSVEPKEVKSLDEQST